MSLFDPVGFLGNFNIRGMILLQRVWRAGTDWDEEIPEEIFTEWKLWVEDLPKIESISIPRCYSQHLKSATIELHCFVDSSEDGYASVCYLRVKHENGVDVSFVGSKIRVAPLKKCTIPRLELMAAVAGTKLTTQIIKDLEVKVNKVVYWSDSSTVLAWLKSTSARHKEFVANRVGFIQEKTNVGDWRWIPTKENVADDATRAVGQVDLSSGSRWLTGPPFLKLDSAYWPKKNADEVVISAYVGEEDLNDMGRPEVELSLPPFQKYSKYYRLLRATAAVAAAFSHWRKKIQKVKIDVPPWEKSDDGLHSNLSCEDLRKAEKRIIKFVQDEAFTNDQPGKMIAAIKNLSVFRDEDRILRIKGQIGFAATEDYVKNPIILPGKSHVAELIVDAEHRRNKHTGKSTVFNNIRQKFWITGGRNVVRRIFAKRNYCRIARAKPLIPEMGDLPSYRLAAKQPVFTFCGVDFFGPIEVTVGRRHEKRWGALFTCMVTRAVYLDIASGLSADEMMMVLSRFIDTHGLPKNMYSDNATNFKAVHKELNKMEKFNGMNFNSMEFHSSSLTPLWRSMGADGWRCEESTSQYTSE